MYNLLAARSTCTIVRGAEANSSLVGIHALLLHCIQSILVSAAGVCMKSSASHLRFTITSSTRVAKTLHHRVGERTRWATRSTVLASFMAVARLRSSFFLDKSGGLPADSEQLQCWKTRLPPTSCGRPAMNHFLHFGAAHEPGLHSTGHVASSLV